MLWFKPWKFLSEIHNMMGGHGLKVSVREAFGSFLTKQIAKFLAFLVKTSSIRPTLVKEIKGGGGG